MFFVGMEDESELDLTDGKTSHWLDKKPSLSPRLCKLLSSSKLLAPDKLLAPEMESVNHQQLKMDISNANEDKKDIEPIQQVLALGAPYPMIVLPVDGEYWMEGNYHVLSRDINDRPIYPAIDMSRCSLSEDNSVYNYRRNFVGKEHLNFVGIDNKHGSVLLSVLLDLSIEDNVPDQYRVILRLKDRTLDEVIPSTTFTTDMPGPRDFMKHFLGEEEVEVERFHPVSVLRASDEITKFDEHTVTNCYKVGVVLQKFGQTTEEDFLQNQDESPAFREFLDLLGTRIDLKDFPNYRGGLDVKYSQTGEQSYYTNYKNREMMFHVSTLLPYSSADAQQLSRKRHIGNDVVCIIFQEENTPFCPSAFRSHFLHVCVVVQVEEPNTENTRYKVSITAKDGVPKFSPSLPNPCIFKKGTEFRNFLLTKILNAEMGAVKSEKFSTLAERTRTMLLQGLVSDFISKNEKLLEDEGSVSNCDTTSSKSNTNSILSSFRSALYRRERSESIVFGNSVNLVSAKNSGQSLSLNDISSLSVHETNNNRKDSKAEVKKTSKEKKKLKKDKRLSSSSISPRSRSPTSFHMNGDAYQAGDISPTLRHPSTYRTDNLSQTKSRQFTNHLFDTENSHTQSLPRNMLSNLYNGRQSPSPKHDRRPVSHVITANNEEEEGTFNTVAAQMEIDKLKAEVNKLKMDKMDLVRQNVLLRDQKEKRDAIIKNQYVQDSPARDQKAK